MGPSTAASRVLLVLLLAAVAVLSGCVGSSDPPEVFLDEPAGMDTIPLNVMALEGGDATKPGAGVEVTLLSGPHGLETATTGPDGVARFWVERPSEAITISVLASGDGWTEEHADAALVLAGHEQGPVETRIPVYRSLLVFRHTYDWEGPATVQMVGDRTTASQALGFADEPAAQHAYSRRVDTLTVDIGWQNTPTAHGDFGVYIEGNREGGEGEHMVRSDADQGVGHQGQANETVTIDRAGLIALVDTRSPDAWYGIDTDEPVVAPQGIPIDVTFIATFRTPVIEVQEGPAVGALAILLIGLAISCMRRQAVA